MPPGALVYRNPVLRTALFYRNPKKSLGEPRGLEYLAEKYPPSEIPSGVVKTAHPSANNDKVCTGNNKMNRAYPVALVEG